MGLLLILPILVSGFLYCHNHPAHFLRLHRYEGQYLYLQAAKLGVLSLIIAILFNLFLVYALKAPIYYWGWYLGQNYIQALSIILAATFQLNLEKSLHTSWLITYSITMLLVPFVMPKVYLLYMQLKSRRNANHVLLRLRFEFFKDSPLDNLLAESYKNRTNLMISLDDRKVYVGRVSSMGEPNETEGADQEIVLIPIMSGHRNKDTLEVDLNIPYETVNPDLAIVIRQERIISASQFDFAVYRKFKELEAQKKKEDGPVNRVKKVINTLTK